MRRPLLLLLTTATLAALAALPTSASARGVAPPGNDDIADAVQIGEGDTQDDTTLGATRESTDPAILEGEHTVWYRYESAIGAPIQIETQAESADPSLVAEFAVFTGEPGNLDTVAVSEQPEPRFPTGHQVVRIPTVEDETYYVGVVNDGPGADFTLTLDRARKPSSAFFPDGTSTGDGRPQLYTEPGRRPQVRVVVRTGFPGSLKPGRGPVTLERTDTGRTFKATLRKGRATFVLPRIKRSYEIVVSYPGTAGIDPASADAYLNASAGPS